MKNLLALLFFMSAISAKLVFADGGQMIGSGGMMSRGGHMGGFMWIFGLIYILAFAVFFWLLFRIARALERIAEKKEKEL